VSLLPLDRRSPARDAGDSLGDAITDEALAGLSPYLTEHINRFGDYVLDLTRPPEPLLFVMPRTILFDVTDNSSSNPCS
jgi:hypothetical protein